jgi:hypothetical protein
MAIGIQPPLEQLRFLIERKRVDPTGQVLMGRPPAKLNEIVDEPLGVDGEPAHCGLSRKPRVETGCLEMVAELLLLFASTADHDAVVTSTRSVRAHMVWYPAVSEPPAQHITALVSLC